MPPKTFTDWVWTLSQEKRDKIIRNGLYFDFQAAFNLGVDWGAYLKKAEIARSLGLKMEE